MKYWLTSIAGIFFTCTLVGQNDSQFTELFIRAEKGDASAQNNLGGIYYIGNRVEQDYGEAFKWFRKAAQQDYPPAQRNLGMLYEEGLGVRQNFEKAFKWYHKAAKQGLAQAQYNVGEMYSWGLGVEQDYVEAFKWYREAADRAHPDAQFKLGEMYAVGAGVKQNFVWAYTWYAIAAAGGIYDGRANSIAIENKMTKEQILEAKRRANKWVLKKSLRRPR